MSINFRSTPLGLILLAGWMTIATPAGALENPADQVSKLLSDAKTQAFLIKEDSVQLEYFTRTGVDWSLHAAAIDQIKDDVNTAGKTLTKLQELRGGAAPWQQTAIDRIKPPMMELIANTRVCVETLNTHPAKVGTPAYQDYVEAIKDNAEALSATVSDFVSYGTTKARLQTLAKKLEIPAANQ